MKILFLISSGIPLPLSIAFNSVLLLSNGIFISIKGAEIPLKANIKFEIRFMSTCSICNLSIFTIDIPIVPYIIIGLILICLVFLVIGYKAYNAAKVDLIKYLKFG